MNPALDPVVTAMTPAALAGLLAAPDGIGLPTLVFHLALVFLRVGAALMLLPGLGEPDLPPTVRLVLALTLSVLLLPGVQPGLPPLPTQVPDLLRLVLVETAIGLWFGMLARLAAIALGLAGQVVALMVGLASPLQLDPEFGGQGTATSRLFNLTAAVLILTGGLWALPVRALADSYGLMPAGDPLPLSSQAEVLATAVAASLDLALRLAAPMMLVGILGNLALGLMARLAPLLPVLTIAAPGQILVGMLLLALLVAPLLATWTEAAQAWFAALPRPG